MWNIPPRQLLLEPGSLHVWRASLDQPAAVHDRLRHALSDNEMERSRRMVRPADRERWVAARASLRIVLAKYVHDDPRLVSIAAEESGKPYLAGGATKIQFSISHSDNLTLIAIRREKRVGIDIERIRDVREMEAIMEDFFGAYERAYLRACEGDERKQAFFLLWTRREAAAKALGLGLFEAFARFTLPAPAPGEGGFSVELPGSSADQPADLPPEQPAAWWIRDLSPAVGFAGALCMEHVNAQPSFYELRQ
jgi:4'-phosphopantetheinyl transferase